MSLIDCTFAFVLCVSSLVVVAHSFSLYRLLPRFVRRLLDIPYTVLCGRDRTWASVMIFVTALLAFLVGASLGLPPKDKLVIETLEDSEKSQSIRIIPETAPPYDLSRRAIAGVQYLFLDDSILKSNCWLGSLARWLAFSYWFLVVNELHSRLLKRHTNAFMFATKVWWFSKKKRLVVICGMGDFGFYLADKAIKDGKDIVCIIEANPNHPKLDNVIDRADQVIIGDASDDEELRFAKIDQAAELHIATGSDARNLKIHETANAITGDDSPIEIFVYVNDPCRLVEYQQTSTSEKSKLRLQNKAEIAIEDLITSQLNKQVFENSVFWTYSEQDEVELRKSLPPLHFFVFGFGDTSQIVIRKLAELAHFPNMKRSRFSIFHDNKDEAAILDFLDGFRRFSQISNPVIAGEPFDGTHDLWECPNCHTAHPAIDCECFNSKLGPRHAVNYVANVELKPVQNFATNRDWITAVNHQLEQNQFQLGGAPPSAQSAISILIFSDDDLERNFQRFKTLFESDIAQASYELGTQATFVWAPRSKEDNTELQALVSQLRGNDHDVSLFGQLDDLEKISERTKRSWEEARRKHEVYAGRKDPSGWRTMTAHFQLSNINAARHDRLKQQYLISTEDISPNRKKIIEILAEMEHNRWLSEKLMNGFEFGKQRTKLHRPQICPFNSFEKIGNLKFPGEPSKAQEWADQEEKKDVDSAEDALNQFLQSKT